MQGGPVGLVFYYPHFSCVRAIDLKFYDFLNNIKTNLVKLFLVKKFIFAATDIKFEINWIKNVPFRSINMNNGFGGFTVK